MKVLITGGSGYCGSVLVPQLLALGHSVTVYDTFWFGNFLPTNNPNLELIQGDIRDEDLYTSVLKKTKFDSVLHLACIANDASFELDERLSISVNYDAFLHLVENARKSGVSRFVYASSSSVYGISEAENVTEEHELVPLTLYNKFKALCEPILLDYIDEKFTGVIFRPATVCGYSPRQRLDLSVNILTNLAFNKGEITVFGGDQLRPNLHVRDYSDVCTLLLTSDRSLVNGEIFNVGSQNLSIQKIAEIVKHIVPEFKNDKELKLITSESSDRRSYHISSEKIHRVLGFRAKRTIEDAIRDLCNAFNSGKLPNSLTDDIYFNVQRMKRLAIK